MTVNGGKLIFYLKNHRREVLVYFRENGLYATLNHYQISAATLDRLMAGDYGGEQRLSKAERAYCMAEIAAAGTAELRREIRELKEQYGQFVELIATQITSQIIKALQNINIELPPELDYRPRDPLKLK